MVKKILSLKGLVVLEVILLVNLLVIGVREGFNQDNYSFEYFTCFWDINYFI